MPPASSGNWSKANKDKVSASQALDLDSDLIVACKQGDRQAQYELYKRYKDWVFNIAYRMANHREEAEDLTQKVFLQIYRNIDSFRGESAFSSWIYRMTVNLSINHFRKDKKRRQHISNELSSSNNPRAGLLKRHEEKFNLRPHLEAAISRLPAGYRMVFILYDIQGYAHNEIATMLDISEGTSKSQLHKARKELRHLLEPFIRLHSTL